MESLQGAEAPTVWKFIGSRDEAGLPDKYCEAATVCEDERAAARVPKKGGPNKIRRYWQLKVRKVDEYFYHNAKFCREPRTRPGCSLDLSTYWGYQYQR